MRKVVYALVALVGWVGMVQAAANVINIGDAEFLYSNAQLPFTMDASFATLKRDSSSMDFFQTDRGTSVYPLRYHGSLANPLQIHDPNAGWDFSGLYTGGVSGPWLGNIYDDGSGTLIGLIHTEDFSANTADFTIGLAKSTDGGANWKYLGDVLQPYGNNASMDLAYCSNIGGLPYLIVGDYMYVYFNEHTAIDLSGEKRLAVARALISDIMTAAASDTVPVFHKYAGGVWTQDGLTGLADNIIPNGVSSHGNQYISPDFHSDAAYCAPLGKYLITVQTHAQGKLLLFTSTDGLNWGDETLVDYVSGYSQPYSTFVSLNSDASNDCHVVGNEFYLIYPHKSVSDYGDDTLYRRRFTIEPVQDTHLVWDPNGNGTDGAGIWNASDLVWTNPASGGADIAWSNSTNDTAVFGVGNGAAGVVTVSGNLTLDDITFNAPGSGNYTVSGGTLTLAGNPSVILANADATMDSVLAGEGFIKNGRGALTLSGENTFSGTTTIDAGTLSITGGSLSNSSAIEVSSGATLSTSVNNTFGSTPTAPWSIAGTISGTANTQTMPPSVTLLNNGTMSGNTFASYGTFLVPGSGATITASGANNTINAGNVGLPGTLTLNTPNATDALTISSILGASSANAGGLSKTGAGMLTLSGGNTYTGDTTVNAGTLSITGGSLSSSSSINVLSGATLTTSVNNTFGGAPTAPWTIGGTITGTAYAQTMPPSVTLNNGTISGNTFASYGTFLVPGSGTTISANGSNNVISAGNIGLGALLTVNTPNAADALTISSVLGASSANTGGLSKTGAGTLTLSGADIYTGPTTVGNGELMISTAFAGNGDFSVANGATLGVSNLSSGSALVSSLTVSGGATLEFQNVTDQATPLVTASDLTISGSCMVTITGGNGLEVDASYPLIGYAGTFSGQLADLHLQMPNGYEGTLVNTNNQLSLLVSSISVPNGLTAASGDNQVTLNWTAPAGATSYNVKRSLTSGGPYTLIANPSTNSYTDMTAANGTAYYYIVSALSGSGESPDSIEVSAVPQSPYQVYLKFDEASGTSAADASGNGWDGMLVNGPTWVSGYSNNAVNLNGSSQYVTLPDGVLSDLTDFTISAWVKQTSISTWSRIFDFGTGTTANMFLTPRNGENNRLRFAITTSSGAGEQQIDGTVELPTGVWTHVAVTHSGNTGILYVDGVPVGTNSTMTLTPADLGSTTQNYIGKSQYPDPYLNGQVDEFRIYPTALTASQVNEVMTGGDITPPASSPATIIDIANAPAPLFDDPVFHGATDPFVIWNPQENLWFMYYTQRRSSMPNPTGVEWVYGTAIGIATSPNGTNWTYAGVCQGDHDLSDPLASTVGVGPEPGVTFWAPCYYYEGTTLHMFVSYINGVYTDWGGTRTIIHFTSTDGVNFSYVGVCDLGNAQVIDPSVYKVGSTYYMVYKNESDGQSTWVAQSTDLTTWTNPRRTSPDTFQEAPFVFQWKGSWWLMVDSLGNGGLRIYQSANGIDGWTENNVVLTSATPGIRPEDGNVGHHPGIVVQTLDDGTEQCLLFYFTHQGNLSVMQVAELELGADGKVTCNRNKYAELGDVILDLKLDETSGTTASDSSGNGWDGTLINGPAWVAGTSSNAVNLSGSDQYVTLPAGVVGNLTDFTVSVWVKQTTISTWSRVFDFGTGTDNYMFLTPKSGDGNVRFAIRTPSASEQIIDGTAALPTNVWTHVAITHSGNTGVLYVDGVPVGTNSTMTFTPSNLGMTTQNYIGKSQYDDPYFNGQVDEFRIYSSALSPSEIATLVTPLAAPANLSFTLSDGLFEFSWPADHTGWRLQMSTNLLEANWQDVSGAESTNFISVSPTNSSTFFRLVYP